MPEPPDVPTVDIDDEEVWKQPPVVTEPSFDQRASLRIAGLVLAIFAGIYLLCFVVIFCMIRRAEATFDSMADIVKFMVSSVLPLVTLAVGYYLGERSNSNSR
jgi:hypothetical protein